MSENPEVETTPAEPEPASRRPVQGPGRSRLVALACGAFAISMVGAAYAAVPLYQMFCQVTGFGGATRVAAKAPKEALGRVMEVRFDTNVAPGLAWEFQPDVRSMQVRVGETKLAHFRVTSRAKVPTTGAATYNVTPGQVGAYFAKLQCFCFTDQKLDPGETIEMPVVFFVDPDLAKDPEMAGVKTITLSYTFFAKAAPVAKSETTTPGKTPAKAPL